MAKISFFTVLFSFLILPLSAFSQNTKTTLKESFLVDYVAQKEKVESDDIRRIVLKKDKTFKKGVILLNNSMACGIGLCTYYAFTKNPKGSFDFAGMIEGVFKESKTDDATDLPEIITETRAPNDKTAKMSWIYNKETKLYETK